MASPQVTAFQECFEVVTDPRVTSRCDHPLHSILFLVVSAVISGADGPADIEDFGLEKQDGLAQFFDLPAGVPGHDTIGRLLAMLKPRQLQAALLQWITRLRNDHHQADNVFGRSMTYRGTQGTAILGFFDRTIAMTGNSEKCLRRLQDVPTLSAHWRVMGWTFMTLTQGILFGCTTVVTVVVLFVGWRWASRFWSLPCPSLVSWALESTF
ncbi:transposase family protein [Lignipirellula cremea]|uniref:H repeat-associated protein N-terminal domain-containing protein n=1 Tax=Lignipirellula cremea TaxID=2528010 RepID=A0A518DL98_9BACT|nr:transposase family protein [Lignipirellula cremea]QDU92601.1 hypothetical protein Pla8534_03490 [Lignipirellula cremea]